MVRKPLDPINDQEWMNTYADMVTLLMTFFVMLFSMSSVDAAKLQALVMAFQERGGVSPVVVGDSPEGGLTGDNPDAAMGNSTEQAVEGTETGLPENFDDLYEYLKQYVVQNGLEDSVELTKADNQVFVRFNNNIFFDADSDYLRNDSKQILDYMGEGFKAVEDQILVIRINGHTAAVPNAPDYHINDRVLSSNRANSVAIYLEELKEINGQKLLPTGYGKYYPLNENETPEGREKNRRVDMLIMGTQILGDAAGAQTTEELYNILQGKFEVEVINDAANSAAVIIPPTVPEEPKKPLLDTAPPEGLTVSPDLINIPVAPSVVAVTEPPPLRLP